MIYVAAALFNAVSGITPAAAEKLALENVMLVNEHIRSAAAGVFSTSEFSRYVKHLDDRVEVGVKEDDKIKGFCVESRCVRIFYEEMMSSKPVFRSKCDRVVFDSGLDPNIIHCEIAVKYEDGRSGTARVFYRLNDKKINRIVLHNVIWKKEGAKVETPSASRLGNSNG